LLIIGAENDTVIKPWMVQRIAEKHGTTGENFPGMAHDVMLETGWEKVVKRILKGLEEEGF
jgi:alpha-beta hydrolase superfamily lysophospholipase